jgi:membrane-bound inhibitor of C-type lysozyme
MVPEPVYFKCGESDSLDDTVIAVFYQESQLPAAVLTRGDDQVIALLSPSGSGSKYEGRNVTFWEKGGEALVTWKHPSQVKRFLELSRGRIANF